MEVVVEATGHAPAGIAHARRAIAEGKHIVMVNVEADVLAGVALAREAERAGVVYSLAYGDQPALICELVDWARACGFRVIAAGKGTKYLPEYHASTPATVWPLLRSDRGAGACRRHEPADVQLVPRRHEIRYRNGGGRQCHRPDAAAGRAAFPALRHARNGARCCGRATSGALHHAGQVEVISSLHRDGRDVTNDLRWGVYVVFEAPNDYTVRCFKEYGVVTDASGRISALYRPFHLIGLELNVSILSAALRREPTGAPTAFRGDVVATAKRDLKAGETLDGEGGACVWGKLLPAATSLRDRRAADRPGQPGAVAARCASGAMRDVERCARRSGRRRVQVPARDGSGDLARAPEVFRRAVSGAGRTLSSRAPTTSR